MAPTSTLPESESVAINDVADLVEDFSAFYLNQKFSDVIFTVSGEKLHAHRAILAARSEYFETLLYSYWTDSIQAEITITDVSPDAFRMLLKYIYTGLVFDKIAKCVPNKFSGSTIVTATNVDMALEVMSVAHKYALKNLESKLSDGVKLDLSLQNVISILNVANQHNLEDIKEKCYVFLDEHASEILADENFLKLTLDSLVELLGRNSFCVDEMEIFKGVLKWHEIHKDVGNLAMKSIRLSQMSVEEIVSVVRPSQLFSDEVLLTAVTEIIDAKPKTTAPRAKLLVDVNVATPKYKAEVLHGLHRPDVLLTGNRSADLWISHDICYHSGICIKLGKAYIINHINMRLFDKDTRYYKYYVEISNDQETWKKIVDYTDYPCMSNQKLYFEPEKVQYIRVVGTQNTENNQFHLVFFEAYYSSTPPVVINQIVCPHTTVAARVINGSNPSALLNNANGEKGYTYHVVNADHITVQFGQPYIISTMKMRLWDQDNRVYRYYIETSTDQVKWEMAVDRRNENCQSWQNLTFDERVVVFVRIIGTFNSANDIFHVVHFEAPSTDEPVIVPK